MNISQNYSILIAYGNDGHHIALNVVGVLESIAEIRLCTYEQAMRQSRNESDVALCIVTNEESIELAHLLQGSLDPVPTLVAGASCRR